MPNLTIRSATPLDCDWIISQLKIFSEELGTVKKLFGDEDYVRARVIDVLTNHAFFVAEKDGSLVGFICGFLVPHYFNPQIITLTELIWWVIPSERGTEAGKGLMEKFIEFGKEKSHWIAFGLNEKTPVKDERLFDLGFKNFERSFLMEV